MRLSRRFELGDVYTVSTRLSLGAEATIMHEVQLASCYWLSLTAPHFPSGTSTATATEQVGRLRTQPYEQQS